MSAWYRTVCSCLSSCGEQTLRRVYSPRSSELRTCTVAAAEGGDDVSVSPLVWPWCALRSDDRPEDKTKTTSSGECQMNSTAQCMCDCTAKAPLCRVLLSWAALPEGAVR